VDDGPVFSRGRYEDHVSKIRQACEWLAITQGRAATYARLVTESFKDGARTQEHVLAYNESGRSWICSSSGGRARVGFPVFTKAFARCPGKARLCAKARIPPRRAIGLETMPSVTWYPERS
jgi:hypothetical protein